MLHTLGTLAAVVGLLAELVLATAHCIALVSSVYVLHRRKVLEQNFDSHGAPNVSIIKPLFGVTSQLEHNLESFFLLDYPVDKFEILFCVKEPHDPAVDVVRHLQAKYPLVQSHLFLGGQDVGINPKINNIMPAVSAVKAPWLWIADASLYAPANTLKHMIHGTSADVALVHQAPFSVRGSHLASRVFEVFFGTAHTRIYLVADALKINCVNGMSILVRTSALNDVGGLSAFAPYIAEDFFLAEAFLQRRWKLVLCDIPALQNPGMVTLHGFANRMARWIRLRFAMNTLITVLEPLSECVLVGCLFAWALHYFWHTSFAAILSLHLLTCMTADFILLHRVTGRAFRLWDISSFIPPWLCRELMALPLYLFAISDRHITWGGRRYKLLFSGQAVCVNGFKA